MASIQQTDLLLINRGGADYQAEVGELPGVPGATGAPGANGQDGTNGIDGTNGVDGTAATVDVGTTTTGEPGTNAIVENTGSITAAQLAFTIPRGEKGDKGDTGDTGDDGTNATVLIFKGTVCLTSTNIPANPQNGDGYLNNCEGTSVAGWAPGIPTGTDVVEGDLVAYDGINNQWIHFSTGTSSSGIQAGDNISLLTNDEQYIKPSENISLLTNDEQYIKPSENISLLTNDQQYIRPNENISLLTNNVGYITAAEVPPGGVTSVNGDTGDVVIDSFSTDITVNGINLGKGANNRTGSTAFGDNALSNNTGNYNTAIGSDALPLNGTGTNNVGIGAFSLASNVSGQSNVAIGMQSMADSVSSFGSTAVGYNALNKNIGGENNTAVGNASLFNAKGDLNVGIGRQSGYYIEGSNNTILGAYLGTAADATLSDTVIISAGPTERMRIDASGDTTFQGDINTTGTLNAAKGRYTSDVSSSDSFEINLDGTVFTQFTYNGNNTNGEGSLSFYTQGEGSTVGRCIRICDYASTQNMFEVFNTGNVESLGTITANAFVGNGSGLTGIMPLDLDTLPELV